MKTHRRVGILQQNCITLSEDGVLEKGMPLDEHRGARGSYHGLWPQVDLRQGAQESYKSVVHVGTGVQMVPNALSRVYAAHCTTLTNSERVLRPGKSDVVLLYVPSYVEVPFGAAYPGDPLELVIGPVVWHEHGRHRDGHFILGEAWEDDKTALILLQVEMKVMVGSRFLGTDGQWQTRVVTLVRSPQFLVMRHPTSVELAWYVETTRQIRTEEHAKRYATDGVYRRMHS